MKSGRILDALIAEKVMGWQKLPSGEVWNGPCCYVLKPYSTDIKAAWEVVEKIPMVLLPVDGGKWIAEIGCLPKDTGTEIWYNANDVTVFAKDSAPHAICLAALEAVGYDPNNPEDNK